MKRLTEKGKTYRSSDAFEYLEPLDAQEFIDTIYLQLRQFEDFIEEEGFEDLQDLKRYIEQSIKASELITKKKQENQELKEHTKDLNNKLLNLQLFLKDLRDSFHKEDEVYEEIDKKLKELGEDR